MTQVLPTAYYRVSYALMALLAIALLWAWLGSIDIVVQAQGKLVPTSFVKVSQPQEAGTISEVLVTDGQHVQRGQVLARLDTSQETTDAKSDNTEKARLALMVRAQVALMGNAPLPLSNGSAAQQAVVAEYSLRRQAHVHAMAQATSAVAKASFDKVAGAAELEKQRKTLELAKAAETANLELKTAGLVSELTVGDKTSQRIEREQSTIAQAAALSSLTAAVEQARAALAYAQTDYLKQLAAERTQTEAQLQKLNVSSDKLAHRLRQAELRAPVSGVVNSLAIRTTGQVVAAGTVLMTVVPAGEPLIAEVWVRNEDAGFVFPGMPVQVKVSTYPFQKFGWLDGELIWLGADSEVPESMKNTQGEPLFFKARVRLARQELLRDGQGYALKPGMQVTADVQLGKRSLFEYLTSPLKKAVLEAARER